MNIVNGTVEKVARNGGIMVDGNWYSSFKGKDTTAKGVGVGTVVALEWTPDTKGMGYKNIRSLSVTGGFTAALAAPGVAPAPRMNSNLGVELGHASKLAMDMTIAKFGGADIGSEEMYKFWINNTDKVYKAMAALRKAKEKPEVVEAKKDPILATGDDEPF